MDWFIHDCSLKGQYPVAKDFLNVLTELMRLRVDNNIVQKRLRCSRLIGSRPVVQQQTLSQIILSTNDRNLRISVLKWITSEGPFIDDDREKNQEDYFQYNDLDVTDEGAGEAARRILNGKPAMTFSFEGGDSNYSPLLIEQGLPEDPLGIINVDNIWKIADLRAAAIHALPRVMNWDQAIEQVKIRFSLLLFSDDLLDYLRRETFTFQLVESIFSKLKKLQEFVESRNMDGTNSLETDRLIADHFSGEKAWFTDESVGNKEKFRSKMTFVDPLDKSEKIFCPFHGKIKTPQYRIHFPWPMLQHERVLRIVYIGPKITKD